MTQNFVQTDTAAAHAIASKCAPSALTSKTPDDCQSEIGGSVGVTGQVVTIGNTEGNVVVWGDETEAVNETTWAGGTANVKCRISVGNGAVTLEECHICRVNSSGVSQSTYGSETGIGLSISSAQTLSRAITVTEDTGAALTDRVYVIWTFAGTGHGNSSFTIVPDQTNDYPFPTPPAGDIRRHIIPAYMRAS
jgi:hypothetical protein